MERFYHIRVRRNGLGPVLVNGGATVHLAQIDDKPLHVAMQVSYCNPSDVFCKAKGRAYCIGANASEKTVQFGHGDAAVHNVVTPAIEPKDAKVVHIRDLPAEFRQVHRNVYKRWLSWYRGKLEDQGKALPSNVTPTRELNLPRYEGLVRDWLPDYEVKPVWTRDLLEGGGGGTPMQAIPVLQNPEFTFQREDDRQPSSSYL